MIDNDKAVRIDHIGVDQAAKLTGVSSATIRNWIKTGVICNHANTSGRISLQETNSLIAKIESGEINRLKQRANKTTSDKSIIPSEYISQESMRVIQAVIAKFKDEDISLNNSMLFTTIAYLIHCGEILIDENKEISICDFRFRRKAVEKIILSWKKEQSVDSRLHQFVYVLYSAFAENDTPVQQDLLGAIYQILSLEGSKSENGAYYTPVSIVNDMISDHYRPGMQFLDPCCGTGQFLLSCAKQDGCTFNDLYGIDIDPIAVYLASINLLLAFPEDDFSPKVYNCNTLTDIDFDSFLSDCIWMQNKFDFIATNPPWGAILNKKRLSKLYPVVKSGESYSYFIAKCHDFLKDGGILSLVLPESILNIQVHKDIRKFILTHFTIESITELGRAFTNVFTKVCRMDMKRTTINNDDTITSRFHNQAHSHGQKLSFDSRDFSFVILHNEGTYDLIDKFFLQESVTLKDNADWAIGIVTGDNNKYLSDKMKEGYEPIYRGKDILPMQLDAPKKFIHFTPEMFQQVAPEWKYRAEEKLIYRFISRSLVFAYDNRKVLTLNSANICIPKNLNINMKTLAAIFNSKPYNYLFTMRYNTLKVLRSNLEELPIPIAFLDSNCEIISIANALADDYARASTMDEYLMEYFKLTNSEKAIIRNSKP